MRRLLCFASLVLLCALPSWATRVVNAFQCPLSTSSGSQVIMSYSNFFINSVTVTSGAATLDPSSCNSAYVTYEVTSTTGFDVVFSDAIDTDNNQVTFSDLVGATPQTNNGFTFYGLNFSASSSFFGTETQFLGVAVQGSKSGYSWTTDGSSLTFDPPPGNVFVELYIDPTFPRTFPGVPEPSSLLMMVSGLGILAFRRRGVN